jgi:hypothetical protein
MRRVRHEDAGFTLVELISAVLVTTLGVIALITTLDSSRELITFAETKEAAVHVGERELEQIQSLEYDDIALEDEPVPCNAVPDPVCDLNNPAFYVTDATWYRWDQVPRGQQCDTGGNPRENCEQLVIDTVGGEVSNLRQTFTENAPTGGVRLTVELQRFISWVDDDCVKPAPVPGTCAGDHDYKRITVAVRILKLTQGTREQLPNSGPGRPILLSTVVRPPT